VGLRLRPSTPLLSKLLIREVPHLNLAAAGLFWQGHGNGPEGRAVSLGEPGRQLSLRKDAGMTASQLRALCRARIKPLCDGEQNLVH